VMTKAPTHTEHQVVGEVVANPVNIAVIRAAMAGVNLEGTSATSFKGAAYTSGGKTGTAQVVAIKANEKYNAANVAERNRDHALFSAFAPLENPKIALAIIVENAGFGSQNSAPIARRVFDYWLMGQYPSEEDIAAVQKAQATAPIGKPRLAAEMPLPGVGQ
jgi:penicillin-binding protein 2